MLATVQLQTTFQKQVMAMFWQPAFYGRSLGRFYKQILWADLKHLPNVKMAFYFPQVCLGLDSTLGWLKIIIIYRRSS